MYDVWLFIRLPEWPFGMGINTLDAVGRGPGASLILPEKKVECFYLYGAVA